MSHHPSATVSNASKRRRKAKEDMQATEHKLALEMLSRFPEYEQEQASLKANMYALDQKVDSLRADIKGDIRSISEQIKQMGDRDEQRSIRSADYSRTQWGVLISACTLILSIVGGVGYLVTTPMIAAINTNRTEVKSVKIELLAELNSEHGKMKVINDLKNDIIDERQTGKFALLYSEIENLRNSLEKHETEVEHPHGMVESLNKLEAQVQALKPIRSSSGSGSIRHAESGMKIDQLSNRIEALERKLGQFPLEKNGVRNEQ